MNIEQGQGQPPICNVALNTWELLARDMIRWQQQLCHLGLNDSESLWIVVVQERCARCEAKSSAHSSTVVSTVALADKTGGPELVPGLPISDRSSSVETNRRLHGCYGG